MQGFTIDCETAGLQKHSDLRLRAITTEDMDTPLFLAIKLGLRPRPLPLWVGNFSNVLKSGPCLQANKAISSTSHAQKVCIPPPPRVDQKAMKVSSMGIVSLRMMSLVRLFPAPLLT